MNTKAIARCTDHVPRDDERTTRKEARLGCFKLNDAGGSFAVVSGGPLGLRPVAATLPRPPHDRLLSASDGAERLVVGRTRNGEYDVRMTLATPTLKGTEVQVLFGPSGVELIFVAASEEGRRRVEGELQTLAKALANKGIVPARMEIRRRGKEREGHTCGT